MKVGDLMEKLSEFDKDEEIYVDVIYENDSVRFELSDSFLIKKRIELCVSPSDGSCEMSISLRDQKRTEEITIDFEYAKEFEK